MRGGDGMVHMLWGTRIQRLKETGEHRKLRPTMDTRIKSSTATTKSDSGAINKTRVIGDRSYSK